MANIWKLLYTSEDGPVYKLIGTIPVDEVSYYFWHNVTYYVDILEGT